MKTTRKLTALLAAGLIAGAVTAGAQTFYSNDFTTTDNPLSINQAQYDGQDPWTLNTAGSGNLNFAATNIVDPNGHVDGAQAAASVQLAGWAGQDFVISSTFTLNTLNAPDMGGNNTVGFGFLSSNESFTGSYYKADLAVGTSNTGRLTVTETGSSGTWTSGGSTVFIEDSIFEGSTIELRVTGTYDESGTLSIVLSAFDGDGAHLGTRNTATDTGPLTGEYFGFRNRVQQGTGTFDTDFHDISVIPEPSAVAFMFGGIALAMAFVVRRVRRA